MRRSWVDLIREERDHPERERERRCGGCAVWRLAAGAVETERKRELGADAVDGQRAVDGQGAVAARWAGEDHDRVRPPASPKEFRPDPPAPAPSVPGSIR